MELRDLKRRHWIILGLLAGLAIGGMRAFWGPGYRHAIAITLSQQRFEEALLRPSDALRLGDIVVHPPEEDGVTWVTGRFSKDENVAGPQGDDGPRVRRRASGAFKCRVPPVYKPRLRLQGMSSGPTTIRAYLDAVAAALPGEVAYRYAWHERKAAVLAIWSIGAVVLIGGVWPTVINILVGAGLGGRRRQAESAYDLDRFSHEPATPAPAVTLQDEQALDSFTAELEHSLSPPSAFPPGAATDNAPPPAAPVPVLAGEELEAPPEAAKEDKEYAGEFYPTAAHAPAKPAQGPSGGAVGLEGE